MSTNKYQKHILVLPEDDANRQIAHGFAKEPKLNDRVIEVARSAKGWRNVLNAFQNTYVHKMDKGKGKMMFLLMLIDFDGQYEKRLGYIKNEIPDELKERVFVLGAQSEPENLKNKIANLKTFENIGKALAQDCVNETDNIWGHDLLKHNRNELERMISSVKPFLFKEMNNQT